MSTSKTNIRPMKTEQVLTEFVALVTAAEALALLFGAAHFSALLAVLTAGGVIAVALLRLYRSLDN